MKAFLIDPSRFTVESIDIHPGNVPDQLYKHIGCDRFDAVYLEHGDTLYVDDEGLLKPQHHFILIDGHPQPYAGKGVLLGSTPAGNNADAKATLEDLVDKLTYMERLIGPVVSLRKASMPSRCHMDHLAKVLARLEAAFAG
ncbi:MAG: hypothetical protein AB7E81_04510 [Hyphomicrobiaceae bacterium]